MTHISTKRPILRTIVNCLLCTLMVVSAFTVNVIADQSMVIRGGSVKSDLGTETVEVPVTIENNAGFISGQITVEWDYDALTLKNVLFGIVPDYSSKTIGAGINEKYYVTFGSDTETTDYLMDGTLFTLVFSVNSTAQAGTYDIKLSADSDMWVKADLFEPMASFTLENGSVMIQKEDIPEPEKYLVTFDSDGGSTIDSQTVEANTKASKPADPIKEGFTFKGWYLGESEFDFDSLINESITLKAKWENSDPVNYEMTIAAASVTAVSGTEVIEVPITVSNNSGFIAGQIAVEWNYEALTLKNVVFGIVPDYSSQVIGEGVNEKYYVTFGNDTETSDYMNDGTLFTLVFAADKNMAEGVYDITLSTDVGMWAKADLDSSIGEIKIQSGSVTIEKGADPEPITFTITFNTDGGSEIASQKVVKNSKITRPEDPKKDGYVFKGWYYGEAEFDFDTIVTENISLHAVWEKDTSFRGDILDEDYQYLEEHYEGVIPEGIWTSHVPNAVYTGDKILLPNLRVYDGYKLLQNKTDYTITYKNNTKAYTVADPENPTATDKKKAPQIIIKANKNGNYTGNKAVYFSIEPVALNGDSITVDELSVQATGKPLSPVPTVYFNGKKLKAKTDYTVKDYGDWDRLSDGDHTITIEGNGNFQGTRNITVHVASNNLISVAKLSVSFKTLKYEDLNGDNFDEEIVTAVTVKNGKKTVPEEGYYFEDIPEDYKRTGTIKFTLVGNKDAGYYGKKTVTVKITGIALTDKKIKTAVPSYAYTGEPQTLGNDFSINYSEEQLEEGKDYTVESYSNNINAGTATVVLKGLGNYTGTRKVTFKITPADAAGKNITVEDAYYTKGGAKPKVTIEGLTEGKDYTVKYANNKAVTTPNTSKLPTVTVMFKGNYKGTVTKDFYIDHKPINAVTITAKDKVYSAKANAWKSAPVLTDSDGKKLKAGVDYEKVITYTIANGEELPMVVSADTVIKVTVKGMGNYTGETSTFYRILDTGKDISKMTFKIANKEYTGSAVTIKEDDITSIKLGKKDQDLKYGTDYIIAGYTNNINKGTAKVTFCGKGDYGGTKTVSFKIGKRNIVTYWSKIQAILGQLF